MEAAHVSVLTRETMAFLQPTTGGRYLDGTLGGGGHAEQLLVESSPDGQVLGLDWDDVALDKAQQRLARFGARLIARRASYAAAEEILAEIGWDSVHGVVVDLGVSSFQLNPPSGFSLKFAQLICAWTAANR
jgi:16S rRNA (cytosine1402-N4)-methyltransferase